MKEPRTTSKYLWIGIAVIVLAAAGLVYLANNRDPVYQGRTLSSWMEDLEGRKTGQQKHDAAQALRAMGTNILPRIIRKLEAEDTRMRLIFVKLAQKQTLFQVDTTPAALQIKRGMLAVEALGPAAKEAYPIITNVTARKPEIASNAVGAACALGEISLPFLMTTFQTAGPELRRKILARCQQLGDASWPIFLRGLEDEDATVRAVAAYNVRGRGGSDLIIGALAECLADSDADVRMYAAEALRSYGTNAVPALLVFKGKAQEPRAREAVDAVLTRIESGGSE